MLNAFYKMGVCVCVRVYVPVSVRLWTAFLFKNLIGCELNNFLVYILAEMAKLAL